MKIVLNDTSQYTPEINEWVKKCTELLETIMEQREEILSAFVAKYGFQPDECEQVIEHGLNGKVTWSIRRKENL